MEHAAFRALKPVTVPVPGRGLVVFNKGSVKQLPIDLVARNRYIEREILEAADGETQIPTAAPEQSASKKARAAAQARRARRREGPSSAGESKSPMKNRAVRKRAKAAAADAAPEAASGGDAPID